MEKQPPPPYHYHDPQQPFIPSPDPQQQVYAPSPDPQQQVYTPSPVPQQQVVYAPSPVPQQQVVYAPSPVPQQQVINIVPNSMGGFHMFGAEAISTTCFACKNPVGIYVMEGFKLVKSLETLNVISYDVQPNFISDRHQC